MLVYKSISAAQVAKKYDLPNIYILINWIRNYKSKLEREAVTLVPMEKPNTKDTVLLEKRINDLKTTFEKANVRVYGLNAMIDDAEKESPYPKKGGINQ